MAEPEVQIKGTATILLVEDDESVLELAREVLENSGYIVKATYLPRVALKMVEERSMVFDLLLTDLVMPQMNGPELYDSMRELLPTLPVLYMSGYSGKTIENIMGVDKSHFLPKPFKPYMLLEKISRILEV